MVTGEKIFPQPRSVQWQREWDRNGVILRGIAHQCDQIDVDRCARNPVGNQRLRRLLDQDLDPLQHPIEIDAIQCDAEGLLLQKTEIGRQAAKRGKGARCVGHHDRADAVEIRQSRCMHRTATAKGEERTVSPIDAAFHRHPAQRPRHGGVGDLDDAECSFLKVQVQRLCNGRNGAPGSLDIEADTVPEPRLRVEIAEHGVGIGDRRRSATAAIAGRAGFRPRALGSHGQAARPIAHDRTTSRTDRVTRQHRLTQRSIPEHPAVRHLRLSIDDQADVGGGTTHVEGEHSRCAELARNADRRRYTSRRPGHRHHQGAPLDRGNRNHGSGGMEHLQAGPNRQALLQLTQIFDSNRHRRRIEHRRRRALIFSRLRIDLM